MNKLTKHGKSRLKQRVDNNKKESALLLIAKKNGYDKKYYTGDFYKYLHSKCNRGCKVIVYNEKVYIISQNSKRLVTVYDVPEKFQPSNDYMVDHKIIKIKEKIIQYKEKPISITLKNNSESNEEISKIRGYLYDTIEVEEKFNSIAIKQYNEEIVYIDTKEIDFVDIDADYITEKLAIEMGIY